MVIKTKTEQNNSAKELVKALSREFELVSNSFLKKNSLVIKEQFKDKRGYTGLIMTQTVVFLLDWVRAYTQSLSLMIVSKEKTVLSLNRTAIHELFETQSVIELLVKELVDKEFDSITGDGLLKLIKELPKEKRLKTLIDSAINGSVLDTSVLQTFLEKQLVPAFVCQFTQDYPELIIKSQNTKEDHDRIVVKSLISHLDDFFEKEGDFNNELFDSLFIKAHDKDFVVNELIKKQLPQEKKEAISENHYTTADELKNYYEAALLLGERSLGVGRTLYSSLVRIPEKQFKRVIGLLIKQGYDSYYGYLGELLASIKWMTSSTPKHLAIMMNELNGGYGMIVKNKGTDDNPLWVFQLTTEKDDEKTTDALDLVSQLFEERVLKHDKTAVIIKNNNSVPSDYYEDFYNLSLLLAGELMDEGESYGPLDDYKLEEFLFLPRKQKKELLPLVQVLNSELGELLTNSFEQQ